MMEATEELLLLGWFQPGTSIVIEGRGRVDQGSNSLRGDQYLFLMLPESQIFRQAKELNPKEEPWEEVEPHALNASHRESQSQRRCLRWGCRECIPTNMFANSVKQY